MALPTTFSQLYQKLLSAATKKKGERIILTIAIVSFLVHLALIFLVDFGFLKLDDPSNLLTNPIAAIYTPFSFILVYEVYLLLYYLPKSITTYIAKQYEIISLIIIRRLFKDLSNLSLSYDWFDIKYDLQFTYDLLSSVVLFFLIFQFYRQSSKRYRLESLEEQHQAGLARFIRIKKVIAAALVLVLIVLAAYTFTSWSIGEIRPSLLQGPSFENINNIFFEQFFTVLIIADVLLLLFSFFYTDEFHKVMRNSGFIISTILLRLSFSVEGLLNNLLILTALLFGLLMLVVHNQFEKQLAREERLSHVKND
jgi:hypothetical protein